MTEVVRFANMTPVCEPLSWGYPLDGKGGVGETVLLPFGEGQVQISWWKRKLLRWLMGHFSWAFLLFQPFTESFMIIDTYPDLKDEEGRPSPKIAIVLATCVPVKDEKGLKLMIHRNFGTILKWSVVEL
jgi:hypothetical protein